MKARKSRRKRFTAEMLTREQKLYLRAGLSHPPRSPEAERWRERITLAKVSGEPRWLHWAMNVSALKIAKLVMHLPYFADADGELRPSNVLDDATAILRSASGEHIDWTKEPLTERERKIRQQIISNTASNSVAPSFSLSCLLRFREWGRMASDLREAVEKMEALEAEWRRERERARVEEAIRQVDESEARNRDD